MPSNPQRATTPQEPDSPAGLDCDARPLSAAAIRAAVGARTAKELAEAMNSERTRRYWAWLRWIAGNPRLPHGAARLAIVLEPWVNRESGEAWPSQARLMALMGLKSPNALLAIVKAMQAEGVLGYWSGRGAEVNSRYWPLLPPQAENPSENCGVEGGGTPQKTEAEPLRKLRTNPSERLRLKDDAASLRQQHHHRDDDAAQWPDRAIADLGDEACALLGIDPASKLGRTAAPFLQYCRAEGHSWVIARLAMIQALDRAPGRISTLFYAKDVPAQVLEQQRKNGVAFDEADVGRMAAYLASKRAQPPATTPATPTAIAAGVASP